MLPPCQPSLYVCDDQEYTESAKEPEMPDSQGVENTTSDEMEANHEISNIVPCESRAPN